MLGYLFLHDLLHVYIIHLILFFQMVTQIFTTKERQFLKKHEIGRLATTSQKGWPAVTPVSYLLVDGEKIVIATDYNTTKYRHLKQNSRASFVVDEYPPTRAVFVQGFVGFIEGGDQFNNIYRRFFRKFDWVKEDPWVAGEAPFLELTPKIKRSWGL